jgi:hypothetical protein
MAVTNGVKEKRPVDKRGKSTPKRKPGAGPGGIQKLDVKKARLGLVGILVVVGVIIGAIALLSGGSDDGSPASAETAETNAVALSESELLAEASRLEEPVFWIGPRAGTDSYELSTTLDGRVYVRYLTGGAEAGDPRAEFLTVGSYPVADARQALKEGTETVEDGQKLSEHDGYAVLSSPQATNAYVVFDDQPEVQVEIFSPQPGEAAQLATSGALKPLG